MIDMTTKTYDAIVIGAGHNGLSAATTLAKSGKSVLVLERHDTVGGMARNTEIAPGVTAPELAHLVYNLGPKIRKELGLDRGMNLRDLPTVSLSEDGNHVVMRGDQATNVDGSPHAEAATYEQMHNRLVKFAKILGRLSEQSPPTMEGGLFNPALLGEKATLAKMGLDLKLLGKTEMREFLRIFLSNAYDVVLDEFEDGPLAGCLAADAVRGAWAGPRSPGTVFSLMYRMGQGGGAQLPIGGMGAVTAAFADAAKSAGAEVRTGAPVSRVIIEDDRAVGVVLADGSELRARAVLSNSGPAATMALAGVEHFDVEATRRMRNHRCKGNAAKLNIMLAGVPEFTNLPADLAGGRLVVAPSAEYVELAFNPIKYGKFSTQPVLEITLPTLSDDSLAPAGTHVMSVVVGDVPQNGWDEDTRDALTQVVLDRIAAFAPDIKGLVTATQLITPSDIEAMTGAAGGHWHHGEMGIDQILTVRPANQVSRYRFGPEGYYLCGAGAHPGGDVSGLAGRNAAKQLIKDGVLK